MEMGVEFWVTIAGLAVWFTFPFGIIISNYLHDKSHIKVEKDHQ
jgi:hypothetical protein